MGLSPRTDLYDLASGLADCKTSAGRARLNAADGDGEPQQRSSTGSQGTLPLAETPAATDDDHPGGNRNDGVVAKCAAPGHGAWRPLPASPERQLEWRTDRHATCSAGCVAMAGWTLAGGLQPSLRTGGQPGGIQCWRSAAWTLSPLDRRHRASGACTDRHCLCPGGIPAYRNGSGDRGNTTGASRPGDGSVFSMFCDQCDRSASGRREIA